MSGHRRVGREGGRGREERRNTDTQRNVSVHVWAPKGGERGREGERGEEKYQRAKKRVRACLVTEGWGEREGGRGREERRWLMGSELKNESETWQSDRLILEEMIALKRFT